ncbi:MAG: hypothetical protein AMS26_15735 [Bacteroides sp. SM23_62]|nr:MAG: hypothetical protein AMS26_15735 [Bacteroides sp. SM23_62]
MILDLIDLAIESIHLITVEGDKTRNLNIKEGFSKIPIFTQLMANRFPDMKVYTSEIFNATSLSDALVLWKGLEPAQQGEVDLRLKIIKQ